MKCGVRMEFFSSFYFSYFQFNVRNTNVRWNDGFLRAGNVNHETSIFFGSITISLVMQFSRFRRKWRRCENAVASKIHISLCVDVIRFRTWFHRIRLSYLAKQIPFLHFLNEPTSCFHNKTKTFSVLCDIVLDT